MTANRTRIFWVLTALLITAAAFLPSLSNNFTNWDDPVYLLNNDLIRHLSPDALWGILKAPFHEMYQPLPLFSFALEYHFFGLNPQVFHVTNLILHLVNCFLVYRLIALLTGSDAVSFITSVLFGIHPLHVESVAWVTERKDMLYTLFFLLALVFYLHFIRSFKKKFYFASWFCYALSIISKPAGILLPFIFFVLDIFEGRALSKKIFLEKVPFLLLGFCIGLLGLTNRSDVWRTSWSNGDNFFYMSYAPLWYFLKLIYPFKLSVLYPFPGKTHNLLPPPYLLSPFLLLLILAALIYFSHRSSKILFGGSFFFLNLIPALVWIPANASFVADRYAYLPSIGLFYLFGEAMAWLFRRKKSLIIKVGGAILLAMLILTFSYQTWHRCEVWRNNLTLWEDQFRGYKDRTRYRVACLYEANLLEKIGNKTKAKKMYEKAVLLSGGR